MREPVAVESGARTDGEAVGKDAGMPGGVGREGHDGLGGLPEDAVKK